MKKLMKKIEGIMVSITFAEAGEFETAQQLLAQEAQESATEARALPSVFTTA